MQNQKINCALCGKELGRDTEAEAIEKMVADFVYIDDGKRTPVCVNCYNRLFLNAFPKPHEILEKIEVATKSIDLILRLVFRSMPKTAMHAFYNNIIGFVHNKAEDNELSLRAQVVKTCFDEYIKEEEELGAVSVDWK